MEHYTSTVDIARTVLARAGLTPYNGMQGLDLAAAMAGQSAGREVLLVEDDSNKVFLGFDQPPRARTLVSRQRRLTVYLDQDWGELYDLTSDPLECCNLWEDVTARPTRDAVTLQLAHEMMRVVDRSPWPRRVA